ncbi:AB hydrolase superfamily protein YdjP [Candidatus Izimaplasma bacterium HR1]|jgi:pimeloyl-ACP methyl ester carboxylesterase|uniref:intracellular short-chain-length polyhydroxyalkanoate depolymerase n=1 Tax=Candidatus Izimoplasma sp. HR1 TaxID=1541959 RepID=UPI0004F8C703|nr:AB hydrolase superfamily protein YdjP [Candidatus Izimaplasma bacterium HR1]
MKKNYVELANNEKIYYIDEGTGKETIVMIHGNMSSGIHFKPLIERLKNDYRIIAPDMRGFGDSTYLNGIESLEDLGDDILILLQALKIEEYYLVGWSTGGAVAMKIASQKQKAVKKLILLESCSYRGYPIFKKDELGQAKIGEYYSSKHEMSLDPVQVLPMVNLFESGNTPVMKAVWDQAIYTVNKPSTEDDALYLSETMKQRNLVDLDWCLTTFNMSNFTNGVTLGDGTIKDVICPVLTFWGEKDAVVLEYMIDETVEALHDVKKVTLKDSGHSPLVDCPDELTKNIITFISNSPE